MKATFCNRTKTVTLKMSRSNVWDLEDALNDENFDPLWNIVEILKAALPIDDMSLEEEECDYPEELEVRVHRCQITGAQYN